MEYFLDRDYRDSRWLAHAAAGWDTTRWLHKYEIPPRILFRKEGAAAKIKGETPAPNFLVGLFHCGSAGTADYWGTFPDPPLVDDRHETAFFYETHPLCSVSCRDLIHVLEGMGCGHYPGRDRFAGDQIPSPSRELQVAGDERNTLACYVDCKEPWAASFHWAGYSGGTFRWVSSSEERSSVYELLSYPPAGEPVVLATVPGRGVDALNIVRAYEVPVAIPHSVLGIRERDSTGKWTHSHKFMPTEVVPSSWESWQRMAKANLDLSSLDIRTYGPSGRHWIRDDHPHASFNPSFYPAHVVVVSSEWGMVSPVVTATELTPYWEDGEPTVAAGCIINGDPMEARACLVDQRSENQGWNAANPGGRQFPEDPMLIISGDQDFVNFMIVGNPRNACIGNCLSYSKIGDLGDVVCPVAVIPADDDDQANDAAIAAHQWNFDLGWVNDSVGVMVGDITWGGEPNADIVHTMDVIDNTYRNSGVPVSGVLIESEYTIEARLPAGESMINGGLGELWLSGYRTSASNWTGFLDSQMPYDLAQRMMVYGPSCETSRTSWPGFQFVRAGLFNAYEETRWAGVVGHMNADYGPTHAAFMRYLLDELANIPVDVRKPMAVVVRDVILDLQPALPEYAWGCTFMGGYALSTAHDLIPIGIADPGVHLASVPVGRRLYSPGMTQGPYAPLRFSVITQAHVKLRVYSASGRLVATVLDRELGPGTYTYHWNASEHPNGVYFVTLELDGVLSAKEKLVNLSR